MNVESKEILLVARKIANSAIEEGVLHEQHSSRDICEHMGAVLADAILQSGINYTTVVLPRVKTILHMFPDVDRISALVKIVDNGEAPVFLSWNHSEKIERFENLVMFLKLQEIEFVEDLRFRLSSEEFCNRLQDLNGVGPKTIDYIGCLVGKDSIPVDRHIRAYAQKLGVTNNDYVFLQKAFSFAADLISLSRREFDSWIWRKESSNDFPLFE